LFFWIDLNFYDFYLTLLYLFWFFGLHMHSCLLVFWENEVAKDQNQQEWNKDVVYQNKGVVWQLIVTEVLTAKNSDLYHHEWWNDENTVQMCECQKVGKYAELSRNTHEV